MFSKKIFSLFLLLLLPFFTSILSPSVSALGPENQSLPSGSTLPFFLPLDLSFSSPPSSANLDFPPQIQSLAKTDYQINETITAFVSYAQEDDLSVSLYNQNQKEEKFSLQKTSLDDQVLLSINPSPGFKPGQYTLKVTDSTDQTSQQDFSWGVLAINTDKSIYKPNETAQIDLAVLDPEGMMVCDADLNLVITNQIQGTKDILSTQDGTIKVNPECQIKDFTLHPDYETTYKARGPGLYQMELTAVTPQGTYTITDSFEVKELVPFDIKRSAPTRIYPPKKYPVTLTITAQGNFKGTVRETVPAVFSVHSPLNSQDYSKIETIGSQKIITWNLSLAKGETVNLGYYFQAPPVSPQFYLLGPLTLSDTRTTVFQEGRFWQIASDQVDNIVPVATDISTGWATTGTDHYTEIDEGTTANTTDYISAASGSLIDEFNMGTVNMNGGSVSQIQVYIHTYSTKAVVLTVTLYWTGGNTGGQVINLPQSYTWMDTTFTGLSLTQAQLDSLSIRVQNDAAGGRTSYIATLYAAVTWSLPSIDITGNAYSDEAGTPTVWVPCDGSTTNIALSMNGAAKQNTTCDDITGAFSFSGVTAPTVANEIITVFFDTDGGDQAVLYTKNNDTTSNITDLTPTTNRIWIQSESSESITNANINTYDKTQDSDIPASSDGTDLVADSGTETHINTSDTFAPGGNVDTDNLHIEGTYTGSTETLTLAGAGTGACTTEPGTIRPLCIEGGTFTAPTTTNFIGSTSTIEGTTYVNLGVGTSANATAVTYTLAANTGSSNTVTIGHTSSAAADTLAASSYTLTLSGSGTPLNITSQGVFDDGTSTVVYTSGSGTTALASILSTFYTLQINGAGTFTAGVGVTAANQLTVTAGILAMGANDLVVGSSVSDSGDLTVNANLTQSSSATTTIFSSSGGTPSFSGSATFSPYNLTLGDGATSITVDNDTGDLVIDVGNDFNNTTASTFQASSTSVFNIGGNYTNSGTFTAGTGTGTVTMDAQDTGNTLSGTMTGSSDFDNLTFNDSAAGGVWTFSNDAAVADAFNITGGGVTAPSGTLTIGGNFTNSDTFYHNSGTVAFNDSGKTTTLAYSGTTTFSTFSVATGGKTIQFDNDQQTNVTGSFNIQGTDCTSNRVFLTTDSGSLIWEIDVTGSDPIDVDFVDVGYSTALNTTIIADNATEDNENNTNWTINAGNCVTGPTLDQLMRHGLWFSSGTEQPFTF